MRYTESEIIFNNFLPHAYDVQCRGSGSDTPFRRWGSNYGARRLLWELVGTFGPRAFPHSGIFSLPGLYSFWYFDLPNASRTEQHGSYRANSTRSQNVISDQRNKKDRPLY